MDSSSEKSLEEKIRINNKLDELISYDEERDFEERVDLNLVNIKVSYNKKEIEQEFDETTKLKEIYEYVERELDIKLFKLFQNDKRGKILIPPNDFLTLKELNVSNALILNIEKERITLQIKSFDRDEIIKIQVDLDLTPKQLYKIVGEVLSFEAGDYEVYGLKQYSKNNSCKTLFENNINDQDLLIVKERVYIKGLIY
jgi:hypothetical protein